MFSGQLMSELLEVEIPALLCFNGIEFLKSAVRSAGTRHTGRDQIKGLEFTANS